MVMTFCSSRGWGLPVFFSFVLSSPCCAALSLLHLHLSPIFLGPEQLQQRLSVVRTPQVQWRPLRSLIENGIRFCPVSRPVGSTGRNGYRPAMLWVALFLNIQREIAVICGIRTGLAPTAHVPYHPNPPPLRSVTAVQHELTPLFPYFLKKISVLSFFLFRVGKKKNLSVALCGDNNVDREGRRHHHPFTPNCGCECGFIPPSRRLTLPSLSSVLYSSHPPLLRVSFASIKRQQQQQLCDPSMESLKTKKTIGSGLVPRWWKRRFTATITESDPSCKVVYLGNVLTGWAKGIYTCTSKRGSFGFT